MRWTDIELAVGGEAAYGLLTVRQRIVWLKGARLDVDEPKSEVGKRPVYFPSWLYYDLMGHTARQAARRAQARDYQDFGLAFARPSGPPMRRDAVSAKEVSEQMGHTSPAFTERKYRTVYDSAKREMSDKLESVLSGGACTRRAHNESEAVM